MGTRAARGVKPDAVIPKPPAPATGASVLSQQNLALFVSAGVIVLSAMRVFYFSNFNMYVALEILSVADKPHIVISTIITAVILVGPYSALIALGFRWSSGILKAPSARITLGCLAAVAMPVSVADKPLWWFVTYLISLGIFCRLLCVERPTWSRLLSKGRSQIVASSVAVLFTISVLALPWQPLEKVVFERSGQSTTNFGFVVGEQAGQVLFISTGRWVQWIKADGIQEREMCGFVDTTIPWWARPMSSLLTEERADSCEGFSNK